MTRGRVAVVMAAVAIACAVVAIVVWRVGSPRVRAEPRRIVAAVSAPGLNVTDVERDLATPLEDAARKVQGARRVRVVSREGEVTLELTLASNAQPDAALQSLADALRPVSWPPSARAPIVMHAPARTAFRFVVESDALSLADLRSLMDARVAPALARIPGVASVTACGPTIAAVVRVEPFRAKAHGVDTAGVASAVAASRGAAFEDIRAIGDVPLPAIAGVPVRVNDVATVAIETREGRCDAFAHDRAVVTGAVWIQPDANAARTIPDVRAALARMDLPPGVRLVPMDGAQATDAPREMLRARILLPSRPTRDMAAKYALGLIAQLSTTVDVAAAFIERGAPSSAEEDLTAYFVLVDRAKRTTRSLDEAMAAIASTLRQAMPGMTLVVDDGGGVTRVRVLGEDLAMARATALDVRNALGAVPGVAGIIDDGRVAVRLAPRAEEIVGTLARPGSSTIDVVVRSAPLEQVTAVVASNEPMIIVREDAHRCVTVLVAFDTDRKSLRAAQQAVAANVRLPANIALAWDEEQPQR